ncbi:Borealin N terminal-domain-containing protein [Podospora australis]|uniref:Borealin N terminal-domain-containing protein n=1 Tax=Podospora australis TaxID=1536484 RepID=A0AAN7AIM3_9PEZI|nr:Borealin N terminal-domain-containing protein [Podospora australis]
MPSEEENVTQLTTELITTKTGSSEEPQSPMKRRRTGITAAQKQALIDNLQLEITERARKLRSNYNIHAQSLRTRIEIRVNRIPVSLRKMKMGDLLAKYSSSSSEQTATAASSRAITQGPPVPEKDSTTSRPPITRGGYPMAPPPAGRPAKRLSHEISGGDKENEVVEQLENPKKRPRANNGNPVGDHHPFSRSQNNILSPTSSNTRTVPRAVGTPAGVRSGIARPVSPTKGAMAASNLLSNIVDKARPTPGRPATSSSTASSANNPLARKHTATPSTSSSSAATTTTTAAAAAAKRKRGATVGAAATVAPASRPATRTGRRISGTSESSEGSTSTVVRKRPATAPGDRPPPAKSAGSNAGKTSKRGAMMSSIKKGVAGATSKKTGAGGSVKAASSTTGTGRVLRKRA